MRVYMGAVVAVVVLLAGSVGMAITYDVNERSSVVDINRLAQGKMTFVVSSDDIEQARNTLMRAEAARLRGVDTTVLFEGKGVTITRVFSPRGNSDRTPSHRSHRERGLSQPRRTREVERQQAVERAIRQYEEAQGRPVQGAETILQNITATEPLYNGAIRVCPVCMETYGVKAEDLPAQADFRYTEEIRGLHPAATNF